MSLARWVVLAIADKLDPTRFAHGLHSSID